MPTAPQPRIFGRVAAAAAVLLWVQLLVACAPQLPAVSEEAAALARAAQAEPYPELARVPPRPRLGYTVQQRRRIVQGLIADREQARHAGETLRHKVAGAPPPAPLPATPAATPPPPPQAAPIQPEPAAMGETVRGVNTADSLDDFLNWLLGAAEDDADRGDEQQAPSLPEASGTPAPETRTLAPQRLFGEAEPLPVTGSRQPSKLEFVLVDGSLPAAAQARLAAMVQESRDGLWRVTAEGDKPAVSLRHARLVAHFLVAQGVAAARIELRQAGPGERVRVEWLPAATISPATGGPSEAGTTRHRSPPA